MAPHWRSYYEDDGWLYAWALDGKDVTLQIAGISQGSGAGQDGRRWQKPALAFRGTDKRWAFNRTQGEVIEKMYGGDPAKWVGKWITLYPDTQKVKGETRPAIKVRPIVPKRSAAAAADRAPELLAEPPAPPPGEPTGGES